MGFPPALWFEDPLGALAYPAEGQGLAGRVGHHVEMVRHPGIGEPYTDADVARMSVGVLTEEEVEGIRTGRIANPTVGQVAALAAVFGVPTSYLVDRGEPVFDGDLVEALRNRTVREAAREISRHSEWEKWLVLGIIREFGNLGEPPSA